MNVSSPSRKSSLAPILLSGLAALALWAVFTWPLPVMCTKAVPSSSRNTERINVRYMIPGDHLQLMYHFWLLDDMLSGNTRLFHNTYEFNTGNDAERFEPGSYYLPFSAIFAVGNALGGRSLGWNLAGFISIWGMLIFLIGLARRYTNSWMLAYIAAVGAAMLPFRWATLLGGSPTGFTIMWVPAFLLGLDMAVRDDSTKGGVLAAVALAFAAMADHHVFFFLALLAPVWCALLWFTRADRAWMRVDGYIRAAMALLPVVLLGAASLTYRVIKAQRLAGTDMEAGRSPREVAIFSPTWQGLFSFEGLGMSNHIFVGYVIPVFLLACLIVLCSNRRARRALAGREQIMFAAVILALGGIVALSLGPNGPWDGRLFELCRRFIPKFNMIRQPSKVFCLAPSALALGMVIGLTALRSLHLPRGAIYAVLAVALLGPLAEFRMHVEPALCIVARNQNAYAAVRADATDRDEDPHAIVVPLWPGDSSWASLYEHYCSLYRIRMINGYAPSVPHAYRKKVFDRLASINQGALSDSQLQDLTSRGIHYVILHEDAFPEKVSRFPVAFTLRAFLNHPRLALLKQAGPVWAFRILDAPRADIAASVMETAFFPTLRWEFERTRKETVTRHESPDASGSRYVSLTIPGTELDTKQAHIAATDDAGWIIRMRGSGTAELLHIVDGEEAGTQRVRITHDDWRWHTVRGSTPDHYGRIGLRIRLIEGRLDLDTTLLLAGEWTSPMPGETMRLPAPAFFHAGYTDMATGDVILEPNKVQAAYAGFEEAVVRRIRGNTGILYGPRLPLEPGTYDVEMVVRSDASPGTPLGGFYVRSDADILCPTPVRAGTPARGRFVQRHAFPVSFNFLYSGAATTAVDTINFTRLSDGTDEP